MTDIPGTGKIKKEDANESKTLSVLNIKELKKEKLPVKIKSVKNWYDKLSYWILFGCAASILFVLLAIINIRFLYLAPLGPITAIAIWAIRRVSIPPTKSPPKITS